MRPVTVQFLKYPDHLHWGFETIYLGEDHFGHWMSVPAGSVRWKGDREYPPTGEDAVFCAPHEGWWHLHYNGPTTKYSHFIDIVTPPTWVSENRYEMVDLDLDVVVHRDGTVEIEDEDEFLAHQVLYGYSTEMVQRALEETRHVTEMLETSREPFSAVAADWLARLGTEPPRTPFR